MNEGLLIGRVFIFICILVALFCVIKADTVARYTFNFRKKDWNLKEDSIPRLILICRLWNGIMLPVLIYLFIMLPKYVK